MTLTTQKALEIGVNVGLCGAAGGIIARGLCNNKKYDETFLKITYSSLMISVVLLSSINIINVLK